MLYKHIKYIICLSVFFLTPVAAFSNVRFEPYGSIGGSYGASVSANPLFMTYTGGGRLGYTFSLLSAGVDLFWTHYDTGSSSSSSLNSVVEVYHNNSRAKGFNQAEGSVSLHSESGESSFQPFSVGAFVSADLPFLFDAYGTLFFSSGDRRKIAHNGYGLKAGLSYLSALTMVQLNLELQWTRYLCTGSQSQCSSSKNFDIASAMLSVSVPISINLFDLGSSEEDSDISEPSESDSSEEE